MGPGASCVRRVASIPQLDGFPRPACPTRLFVPEASRSSGSSRSAPEMAVTAVPDGPDDHARVGFARCCISPVAGPRVGRLMRAGMDAAMSSPRRLGPGPYARAPVLVATQGLSRLTAISGGTRVALLEPRSLRLVRPRPALPSSTPPALTTADVRAPWSARPRRAGRRRELNGEGFPYSPYVLLRRSCEPAAMAASPLGTTAPGPAAPPPAPPRRPPCPRDPIPARSRRRSPPPPGRPCAAAPPCRRPMRHRGPAPARDTVASTRHETPAPRTTGASRLLPRERPRPPSAPRTRLPRARAVATTPSASPRRGGQRFATDQSGQTTFEDYDDEDRTRLSPAPDRVDVCARLRLGRDRRGRWMVLRGTATAERRDACRPHPRRGRSGDVRRWGRRLHRRRPIRRDLRGHATSTRGVLPERLHRLSRALYYAPGGGGPVVRLGSRVQRPAPASRAN